MMKGMKTIYLAIAALAVLSLLILACGDDDEVSTPAPTAAPTPAATAAPAPTMAPTAAPTAMPTPTPAPAAPEPVNPRLQVAMVPPGHQVTMMYRTFQSSTGPQKPMYEHLIYKDRYSGEFTNEQLSTEWTMEPDGTTWHFTLREGVPFHSTDSWTGGEFTAKDVVQTVQTLARDDSLASASIWRDLGVDDSNFVIHNDYQITWNADKPEPLMDFWVAEEWVAGIISKDYWDDRGPDGYHDHPIGTGPFQFVEIVIDSHILHERVEDHWRKTPEFHELQFFFVKEDSTRLAQLLAKEVAIADVPRTQLPEATQRGLKIATSTLPGFYIYAFIGGQYYDEPTPILAGARKDDPETGIEPVAPGYSADDPLRDVRVREALNVAINRDAIRQAFWGDAAIPQAIHNVPPYRYDCKDEWFPHPGPDGGTGCEGRGYPYSYDPDRAKELLAEAGYPDGFEFNLMMAPNMAGVPEGPDVGQAIHSDWGAIGLSADIIEVEFAEVLRLNRERNLGRTVFMMRYATGPAPLGWCFPMSNVAGGCGSSAWEYPELDELYVDLKTRVLPDEVLVRIHRVGDWMYANHLIIPLFFLFPQVGYNPDVLQGYEANMLHMGPVRHHEFTKPVYK